jgi:hypothetical protein
VQCSTIDVPNPAPGGYFVTVTGVAATDEGAYGLQWATLFGQLSTYDPFPLPSFTPAATLSTIVRAIELDAAALSNTGQAREGATAVALLAVGAAAAAAVVPRGA